MLSPSKNNSQQKDGNIDLKLTKTKQNKLKQKQQQKKYCSCEPHIYEGSLEDTKKIFFH